MTRPAIGLVAALVCGCIFSATAGEAPAGIARMAAIPLEESQFPIDLAQPEGRTRWDLSGLATTDAWTRAIEDAGATVTLTEARGTATAVSVAKVVYSDPSGGDAAVRWLHPERDRARLIMGTKDAYDVTEDGAAPALLRIAVEQVGVGWLHLPSGPREVALQRVFVQRDSGDGRGFAPDRLIHRWIDPVEGVVAEVWGPASADGRTRLALGGAAMRVDTLATAGLAKLYTGQVVAPVLTGLGYGWDRGKVDISTMTTPSYATIGDLVNSNTWVFTTPPERTQIPGTTTANASTTITGTGTTFQTDLVIGDKISLSSAPTVYGRVTAFGTGTCPGVNCPDTKITVSSPLGNGTTQTINRKAAEVATTSVTVSASETCNATNCGYNISGPSGTIVMDRVDRGFDDTASLRKTNDVTQRVDTPGSDVTFYLRAGAQNEGVSGNFGSGESKFCYTTQGATTRTPVPLWKFPHQDAGGYYLQPGDSWTSTPFNCEQNVYNGVCTTCGLFCPLYTKACTGSIPHTGTQSGQVVKSGVVTLPSGHTFNAILVRTVADFCVYLLAGCSITESSEVRTVVYLWQVPEFGTVAELDSAQTVADNTSYTSVASTNIQFGLFPPKTIQVTGTTGTTVTLSWDPGADTHRISGYKVYWDTDSGAVSSYAFNSVTNSGQVTFGTNTATISGLTAGVTYYFTVTARSSFTDPSSSVTTPYESPLYPIQIYGDPSYVYPIEVQATTTGAGCTPTTEVTGVMVTKPGGSTKICWTGNSDPCNVGYRVLGSNSPTSAAGFTTLADTTTAQTCWTGTPTQKYFLVVSRGGNGHEGPWGAYGR